MSRKVPPASAKASKIARAWAAGRGAGPGAEDRRAQGKFRYPQAGQAAERPVAEHAGRPRGGICGHGGQVLSSAGSGRRPGSG